MVGKGWEKGGKRVGKEWKEVITVMFIGRKENLLNLAIQFIVMFVCSFSFTHEKNGKEGMMH